MSSPIVNPLSALSDTTTREMHIVVEKKSQRIPVVLTDGTGIETGWSDPEYTQVFNNLFSVHPSLQHQGTPIFTVTHAPTGQGVLHLPTRVEAQMFAIWLLKEAYMQGMTRMLEFEHFANANKSARRWIQRECVKWGVERVKVLPREVAEHATPAQIEVVEQWGKEEVKVPEGEEEREGGEVGEGSEGDNTEVPE